MSDEDEFRVIHLDFEEVQEIIDWATGTAAILLTMETEYDNLDVDASSFEEVIRAYCSAIQMMNDAIPHVLEAPAQRVAEVALDEVEQEEAQVESFREQIEKFEQDGLPGL